MSRIPPCRGRLSFVLLSLICTGCIELPTTLSDADVDPQAATVVAPLFPAALVQVGEHWWIPVGTKVPPGWAIPAPPEPYNPHIHGPLTQTDYENLSDELGPRLPVPHGGTAPSDDPPAPLLAVNDGQRGFTFASVGRDGIYTVQEVERHYEIPSDYPNALVYASADLPSDYACIEMVTIHWNNPTTRNYQGFYNHCADPREWLSLEEMTWTWRQNYARVMGGGSVLQEQRYYAQILDVSQNCWQGQLFNFTTGVWENRTPVICGQSSLAGHGWSIFETHHFMGLMSNSDDCPILNFKGFYEYLLDFNGSYYEPTRLYSWPTGDVQERGICFESGEYAVWKGWDGYFDWYATTPYQSNGGFN